MTYALIYRTHCPACESRKDVEELKAEPLGKGVWGMRLRCLTCSFEWMSYGHGRKIMTRRTSDPDAFDCPHKIPCNGRSACDVLQRLGR